VVVFDGDRAICSTSADSTGAFLISGVPTPYDGREYTIVCNGASLTQHVLPGATMALEVDFTQSQPATRYRHETKVEIDVSAEATFTKSIFATREGLVGGTTANGHVIVVNDHFVALPSRRALSTNFGHEREVRLTYGARTVVAPVWDVGPWNTKDDYWNPTPIRETFKDLARGMPESEAAYATGYNGGLDERGRRVLNPAGIDLADGTFREDLILPTNDRVVVEYLWLDAAGPITGRVSTSSNGAGFAIQADATDTGRGNSPIVNAEMFVDEIRGDGSGSPLTAVDGTFDSANEQVRGAIDAVLPGPHVVYVHALDAYGNWGPLSSSVLGASGSMPRQRTVRHP
jgi:hypothetical protein